MPAGLLRRPAFHRAVGPAGVASVEAEPPPERWPAGQPKSAAAADPGAADEAHCTDLFDVAWGEVK